MGIKKKADLLEDSRKLPFNNRKFIRCDIRNVNNRGAWNLGHGEVIQISPGKDVGVIPDGVSLSHKRRVCGL